MCVTESDPADVFMRAPAVSFEESDTLTGSCAADDWLSSAASGLILFESGVADVTDSGNLDDSALRLQFPFRGKCVSTSSIEVCLEVGNALWVPIGSPIDLFRLVWLISVWMSWIYLVLILIWFG